MPATEPGEPVELLVAARWGQRPGVLTVTFRRVVFSQVEGVVRKRERTHWSTPIEAITQARAEGSGRLVLTRRPGPYTGPHEISLELDDSPRAARLVESLRAAAAPRAGAPAGATAAGATFVTTVMFRCPYCRTVYPELDARCPSCGAPF